METPLKNSYVGVERCPIRSHLKKDCLFNTDTATPQQQIGLSAELRNVIDSRNILTNRTRKKVLCDLDEISKQNMAQDLKIKRSRAINEILVSEIYYLNQLEIIKVYFMKPIKERNILSANDFQTLFGNIEIIYNVNKKLLGKLQQNPNNVAEAFSKIAPYLKLYSVYAYDYKKSLSILQKASVYNLGLSTFLESQESRPEVQSKFSALLISPIQRVPRYYLLLKQVLNYTLTTESTYILLNDSLQKVKQAACHINNLVEEQEQSQQLLELQRSLQNGYPTIIKPDRKFIKAGILLMQCGNQSSKRYLILLSDILMCCKLKKNNPNVPNSLKCVCIFPIGKCKVIQNLSKGSFTVICEEETLVLFHKHLRDCEDWICALRDTTKNYISNRRTLRKDSSSRWPAYKNSIWQYQDPGISPGKPRKKRQLNEKEHQKILQNKENHFEDNNCDMKSCFPFKPTKRKGINGYIDESEAKKLQKCADEIQDSLYPLRQHLDAIAENNDDYFRNAISKDDNTVENLNTVKDVEVFVFGRKEQPSRGFNFNVLDGIFTNVSDFVKRMLGFKNM